MSVPLGLISWSINKSVAHLKRKKNGDSWKLRSASNCPGSSDVRPVVGIRLAKQHRRPTTTIQACSVGEQLPIHSLDHYFLMLLTIGSCLVAGGSLGLMCVKRGTI